MVMFATIVIADSPVSPYSQQLAAVRGNTSIWAVPQTPDNTSSFQQRYQFQGQQYQGRQRQQTNQNFRFVTPEILESLKQQQTQNQLTPENKQPLKPQQSIQNYNYPALAMGLTNPLYDTPAVSPWSSGSDNLYGGESFPLDSKEAIGRFSPFQIMPFGGMNGIGESGNTKGFNPFNFGPYSNLQ